ncbi:hypothetical protein B0I35DRAFT_487064 [Stachybotrys elegans]|uniref:DUF6604 domain-containing protein n=1 Tax=Stachybotrys elegans TaxID=80388 RepID=A0A8K0T2P4_9HYPO|nr:hypothetical protein B0I35DRAFT_487064 [Stachybotrys elegans]
MTLGKKMASARDVVKVAQHTRRLVPEDSVEAAAAEAISRFLMTARLLPFSADDSKPLLLPSRENFIEGRRASGLAQSIESMKLSNCQYIKMRSGYLRTSWALYHDEINEVSGWIFRTAKQCGLEILESEHSDLVSLEPNEHYMPISEYLRLAKALSQSSVKVPEEILAAGRRAISMRKSITLEFLDRAKIPPNDKTAPFVQVLEEICEVLQPATAETSSASEVQQMLPGPASPPRSNVGTQPQLVQPGTFSAEATGDTPDPTSDYDQSFLASMEENVVADEPYLKSSFFKWLCLFHDLHIWRQALSKTYSRLEIDLMSASITTDTVLRFAGLVIGEVVLTVPGRISTAGQTLQDIVLFIARTARGEDGSPTPENELPFDESMEDLLEWIFVWSRSLIPDRPEPPGDSRVPYSYEPYDPTTYREETSLADRHREDKALVTELLAQVATYSLAGYISGFPCDRVTLRIIEYFDSQRISLWFYFAIQVMIDIHRAMRHARLSAFDDLRLTSSRISRSIGDFEKLSRTNSKPDFWPPERDKEIENISFLINRFINEDPMTRIRRIYGRPVEKPTKPPAMVLLSQNPILCGMLMFHLNTRMQAAGIRLVNQWYEVQQLAFLHNLVETQTGQRLSWPDMDLFIKMHGEETIFMGPRPRNATESLERLARATDVSLAQEPPKDHQPESDRTTMLLKPPTKTANIYRYQHRKNQATGLIFQFCDLHDLLDECLKDEAVGVKTEEATGGKQKQLKACIIDAPQLFILLRKKLHEEEPALLFNYFAMHQRSIEILQLIQRKEHTRFVAHHYVNYMVDDNKIASIVTLALRIARELEQNTKGLGNCGEILRTYLLDKGHSLSTSLRTFCKNKGSVRKEIVHMLARVEGEPECALRLAQVWA